MRVGDKYLIIFLVQAILVLAGTKEIFIDYGVGGEGQELFKLLNGVDDKFFVDIGAYDAIFASNTLNLHVNGWTGINIDASPKRIEPFFYLRPEEANLNIAVGQNDVFVTLYNLAEDSSSTVSVKVKDKVEGYKPVTEEVKIPSISMKELCKRFYYRQPLFLTLDIEGLGAQALLGNDWKDKRCRPEIIFSEANQLNTYSGFPLPSEVLKKEGYKLSPRRIGLNEVFIEESVFQKYEKRKVQNSKLLSEMKVHSFRDIASQLASDLKVGTALMHYDPKTDGMYYHFAIKHRPLIVSEIAKSSIQIATRKNSRPIAVFNYNPHYSKVIVPHDNYTLSSITTKGGYKFHNITLAESDGSSYSVYILDHQYEPLIGPQIVSLEQTKTPDNGTASEHSAITEDCAEFKQDLARMREILAQMEAYYEPDQIGSNVGWHSAPSPTPEQTIKQSKSQYAPTVSLVLNIFACLVIVWLIIEGVLSVVSRRRSRRQMKKVGTQMEEASYENESAVDVSN